MMTELTPDQKIVFGLAPDPDGAMLLLGIPKGAWEYMKNGMTHTFDLTSVGLPVKLIIFGCETHEGGRKTIQYHNEKQGIPTNDQRNKDFSIKDKP